jgi:hypothetical protein
VQVSATNNRIFSKTGKWQQAGYLTIALLCWAYLVIRAVSVDITYDEALTIKEFVPNSAYHIISYEHVNTNNHILNTLLIKLLFASGIQSKFLARVPNLLAFGLYAYFAFRITVRYLKPLPGLGCFLLLLLNPFLLDFFSLARGYGLSFGFLMASFYFLLRYTENLESGMALRATGLCGIAVVANFSLLICWMVIFFLVLTGSIAFRKTVNPRKTIFKTLAVVVPLFAIIYEPIRKSHVEGLLFYGGNTGFFQDTLVSLAKYTFYSPDPRPSVIISLIVFLVIFGIVFVVSLYLNRNIRAPKNVLVFLIVGCILFVELQHRVLGSLYIIDRTALFFYPLFILAFSLALNDLPALWMKTSLMVTAIIMFGLNFGLRCNFYKTALWYFESHSQTLLSHFNTLGAAKGKPVRIGYTWPFDEAIDYYLARKKYPYIEVVNDADITTLDYYLFLGHSLEKVNYEWQNERIVGYKRDTALSFPDEHVFVFEHIR